MNASPHDSCAICSKEPEDMLLLECAHNLCLDCATELFAAAPHHTLQCEICFVQTGLDEETVACLSSLAQQAHHPPYPAPPLPPKELRGLQCVEHSERALYFCFDCQEGTICSECILGTVHAGHKVLTLKKASKMLQENLVAQTKELESLRTKAQAEAGAMRARREELVG
jgi:tripartite motif-containing protein 63